MERLFTTQEKRAQVLAFGGACEALAALLEALPAHAGQASPFREAARRARELAAGELRHEALVALALSVKPVFACAPKWDPPSEPDRDGGRREPAWISALEAAEAELLRLQTLLRAIGER